MGASRCLTSVLLLWAVYAIEFYPKNVPHDVRNLHAVSFKRLVQAGIDTKGGRVFHVVKFYSSAGDVNLDPHFARSVRLRSYILEAATNLRSTAAEVSAIDWENKNLRGIFRKEGVRRRQSLPMIKIYAPDNTSEIYTGEYKDLEEYVKSRVMSFVGKNKKDLMPTLVKDKTHFTEYEEDDSIRRMVFAYEPKRGGQKREQAQQLSASLALYFEGQIRFASTKDKKVSKILTRGTTLLPAIFLIPQGEKLNKAIAYPGKLTYPAARSWLTQFMPNPDFANPLMLVDGMNAMKYIPQVEGNGCLETLCVLRGGICVMTLIPREATPVSEFQYNMELIRLTKRALTKRIGVVAVNAVHFTWFDSNLYTEWVETMFGLPDVEFARTLIWWPKKKVWAPYVKAFEPNEVAKWLESATQAMLSPSPEPVLSDVIANFSTDDITQYPGERVCLWMRYGTAPDTFVTDDFKRKLEVQMTKDPWEQKEEHPDAPGSRKQAYRLPRPKSKWGTSYTLTAANFADNVIHTPSHWIVWFQESEPTSEQTQAWNDAAKHLQGKVQFGVVPKRERSWEILNTIGIDIESAAASPKIRLFPARTLWARKRTKIQASTWLDVGLETEALKKTALSLFVDSSSSSSDLVFSLDSKDPSKSVGMWVSGSSASSKPHMVLFPSKDLDNIPTLLQALAIDYGHVVKFAIAKRSDEEYSERMNVTSFPCMRALMKDKNSGQVGVIEVDTSLNFNALARWFDSKTRMVEKKRDVKDEL